MQVNTNQCFVCKNTPITIHKEDGGRDIYGITCARCGSYGATYEFLTSFNQNRINEIGYILSGIAREFYDTAAPQALFTTTSAEEYIKSYPVPDLTDIEAKAYKLIERLKEKSNFFGHFIDITYTKDFPLAYSKNDDEFIALIELLEKSGLVDKRGETNMGCQLKLTAQGFGIAKVIRGRNQDSDQAFIAVWFDDSMDESIEAIKSAISDCGYRPLCIKNEHFSEKIMDKALGEIKKSKFLVVDLTGNRSSVFFEAGFALGLGLDILYVYKKDSEKNSLLDFYVKHYQCNKYER